MGAVGLNLSACGLQDVLLFDLNCASQWLVCSDQPFPRHHNMDSRSKEAVKRSGSLAAVACAYITPCCSLFVFYSCGGHCVHPEPNRYVQPHA